MGRRLEGILFLLGATGLCTGLLAQTPHQTLRDPLFTVTLPSGFAEATQVKTESARVRQYWSVGADGACSAAVETVSGAGAAAVSPQSQFHALRQELSKAWDLIGEPELLFRGGYPASRSYGNRNDVFCRWEAILVHNSIVMLSACSRQDEFPRIGAESYFNSFVVNEQSPAAAADSGDPIRLTRPEFEISFPKGFPEPVEVTGRRGPTFTSVRGNLTLIVGHKGPVSLPPELYLKINFRNGCESDCVVQRYFTRKGCPAMETTERRSDGRLARSQAVVAGSRGFLVGAIASSSDLLRTQEVDAFFDSLSISQGCSGELPENWPVGVQEPTMAELGFGVEFPAELRPVHTSPGQDSHQFVASRPSDNTLVSVTYIKAHDLLVTNYGELLDTLFDQYMAEPQIQVVKRDRPAVNVLDVVAKSSESTNWTRVRITAGAVRGHFILQVVAPDESVLREPAIAKFFESLDPWGMNAVLRSPHLSVSPPQKPPSAPAAPSIRFYEASGSGLAAESRTYATSFPRKSARYIWVEVTAPHPSPGVAVEKIFRCTFEHKGAVTMPLGSFGAPTRTQGRGVIGVLHSTVKIGADWPSVVWTNGWGGETAGNWTVGEHAVSCSIGDTPVTPVSFAIRE